VGGASVVAGTSPTVRQRELGNRLRERRNQLQLTVQDVADKLICSATKISRLETGARRPSLRDVRDLCRLYQIDEPTTAELMRLAQAAREAGWWTEYEDLDLDPYIGLEQEATAITCFSVHYMPGLLQTADYARAIIRAIAPKMDPDIHRQRVDARMRRQQLFDEDDSPRYHVLLDEAVLYRRVGGPAVMAAQLDKAMDAQHRGKANIQVIPFDIGAYAGMDAHFIMLEFDEDPGLPPVVFIEGLAANKYLKRDADIARYRETIEYLRKLALSPHDSMRRMDDIRKIYARG
jgi:transcriptional regulator with XRE-family HTH domain